MSRRYPLALRFDQSATCANAEWCQLKKRSQARDPDRGVLTIESALPKLRWLSRQKTVGRPGVRKSDGNRITTAKQTQQAAVEAVQQRCSRAGGTTGPTIKEPQAGGAESLRAIAKD